MAQMVESVVELTNGRAFALNCAATIRVGEHSELPQEKKALQRKLEEAIALLLLELTGEYVEIQDLSVKHC